MATRKPVGRWIAFEGGEGSGKSTQAAKLAPRLDATLTREPGATELGVRIRQLVLENPGGFDIDIRSEALLMAADRAQHMQEIVLPTLAGGRDVVSDRSSYSTLAYQGYGRGLDLDELRALCDWAAFRRWPDLVIFLDTPVAAGRARLEGDPDRMERAGEGFHDRVLDGFRKLAAAEPERFLVLDGTRSVDSLAAEITDVCAVTNA